MMLGFHSPWWGRTLAQDGRCAHSKHQTVVKRDVVAPCVKTKRCSCVERAVSMRVQLGASGRVNGEKERGSSGRRECGQTADQGEHGGHAPGRLTKRGEKCANYMPEM